MAKKENLTGLSDKELKDRLESVMAELQKLYREAKERMLKAVHLVSMKRREVARLKTEMGKRERANKS